MEIKISSSCFLLVMKGANEPSITVKHRVMVHALVEYPDHLYHTFLATTRTGAWYLNSKRVPGPIRSKHVNALEIPICHSTSLQSSPHALNEQEGFLVVLVL